MSDKLLKWGVSTTNTRKLLYTLGKTQRTKKCVVRLGAGRGVVSDKLVYSSPSPLPEWRVSQWKGLRVGNSECVVVGGGGVSDKLVFFTFTSP